MVESVDDVRAALAAHDYLADDGLATAIFLASDLSSWITGQTYPVNGGYTLSL